MARIIKGRLEKTRLGEVSASIVLFRCVDDEEQLYQQYRKLMAKRLIYNHSQSLEREEKMLKVLTEVYGHTFTRKPTQMLADARSSLVLNNGFDSYLQEEDTDLNLTFRVNVIKSGIWPVIQTSPTDAFPQELETPIQKFNMFYERQFDGRKLTWLHSIGSAEVHSLQFAIMRPMASVMPGQKYNWRASANVFDLPVCCKCRLASTLRRAAGGTIIRPWNVRNIPWTDILSHWALYW